MSIFKKGIPNIEERDEESELKLCYVQEYAPTDVYKERAQGPHLYVAYFALHPNPQPDDPFDLSEYFRPVCEADSSTLFIYTGDLFHGFDRNAIRPIVFSGLNVRFGCRTQEPSSLEAYATKQKPWFTDEDGNFPMYSGTSLKEFREVLYRYSHVLFEQTGGFP